MVLPPEDRLEFFVYIVESPSPVDLYQGRSEADLIRQAVSLNQIPCFSRIAVNLPAFIASLRLGLSEVLKDNPSLNPILHISAHGSKDGIQLTSGEVLEWDEFRDLLKPINKALRGALVICMSTCEGYSASKMAMHLDDEPDQPFLAIVGCGGEPTWPEAAVAFATFYHLVANGHLIPNAVRAMGIASGNENFWIETAEEIRQSFVAFVKSQSIDTQAAAQELQEEEHGEPSSVLAKRIGARGKNRTNKAPT